MSLSKQINTGDLLRKKSRKITDPAGREVVIIDDRETLTIAEESGCEVHSLYIHALSLGIYPYRYVRNMQTITPEEQIRLAESRVAVVGAGGLGGQVILLLARVGIGNLVVIDYDFFDETNLNRQALCTEQSLDESKSETAASVVSSINPGVNVFPYQVKLDLSNAFDILTGSDVVVDGLDNVPDRFVLERTAKKIGIPLVHGALAGFEGQMMTVFPDDAGLKYLYGDTGINGDRTRSPESILGVPAPMSVLIATLQAMEVLKIILKRGKVFRNAMVHVDLESGEIKEFIFKNQD